MNQISSQIVKLGLTLVPWTIFKTPLGKPASIANSASIMQAPDMDKNNIEHDKKRQ